MKTTLEKRDLNILEKASEMGFEFNFSESFENQIIEAEAYILNNTEAEDYKWEYCELIQHRQGQYASWSDDKGFEWSVSGEVSDYSKKKFIKKNGNNIVRLPHSLVVDTDANVIQLYDERTPDELEVEFEQFEELNNI